MWSMYNPDCAHPFIMLDQWPWLRWDFTWLLRISRFLRAAALSTIPSDAQESRWNELHGVQDQNTAVQSKLGEGLKRWGKEWWSHMWHFKMLNFNWTLKKKFIIHLHFLVRQKMLSYFKMKATTKRVQSVHFNCLVLFNPKPKELQSKTAMSDLES